jgi:cytochrome c oxidase cbb3-type subunit 2
VTHLSISATSHALLPRPNCAPLPPNDRRDPVNHEPFEKNSLVLLLGILIVVSIGGLVQIAPLFWVDSTIEKVKGMRPYTPLEQAGRDIYIREGCYGCHSQMVRTLRDEVERYGHYSLAAESMYDHPFQWGSKRTGPDLARVGGKYSDQWHADHLINPRAVVPESIMPGYPWLAKTPVNATSAGARLRTLQSVGVPYSDEMIATASADMAAQINPDSRPARELAQRYPKAKAVKFDGTAPGQPSELDALIAYMQVLGTMVDFATFDASGPNLR